MTQAGHKAIGKTTKSSSELYLQYKVTRLYDSVGFRVYNFCFERYLKLMLTVLKCS